jgi:beta-N-acetylhexosaminidase
MSPATRRVGVVGVVAMVLLAACGEAPAPEPTAAPSATSATTSASPSTEPSTTTPPPPCTTAGVLATWSVARLAEQTVVIPIGEDNVSAITAEVAAGAGGIILFGSRAPTNLGSSLKRLTGHAPDGIAPFVMTDEEGGVVQRMANLVGDMPSARQMAATMSAAQIERLARDVGQRMKANGITMDLAPVLDLDGRPGPSATNPDGTRSFSPTEKVAEADGLAFARGLRAAGVVPVVKHFPGLGGASGNTDSVAAKTLPWSTLQADGLRPFAAAVTAGLPAVMMSNASVPGLTTLPASLSPTATTTVLREQLHFSGLIITDSLSATAIRAAGYMVQTASVQALGAGADMVLFNATASTVASLTRQVVQAITSAVQAGTLSRSRLENAVLHILAAKNVTLCRP